MDDGGLDGERVLEEGLHLVARLPAAAVDDGQSAAPHAGEVVEQPLAVARAADDALDVAWVGGAECGGRRRLLEEAEHVLGHGALLFDTEDDVGPFHQQTVVAVRGDVHVLADGEGERAQHVQLSETAARGRQGKQWKAADNHPACAVLLHALAAKDSAPLHERLADGPHLAVLRAVVGAHLAHALTLLHRQAHHRVDADELRELVQVLLARPQGDEQDGRGRRRPKQRRQRGAVERGMIQRSRGDVALLQRLHLLVHPPRVQRQLRCSRGGRRVRGRGRAGGGAYDDGEPMLEQSRELIAQRAAAVPALHEEDVLLLEQQGLQRSELKAPQRSGAEMS